MASKLGLFWEFDESKCIKFRPVQKFSQNVPYPDRFWVFETISFEGVRNYQQTSDLAKVSARSRIVYSAGKSYLKFCLTFPSTFFRAKNSVAADVPGHVNSGRRVRGPGFEPGSLGLLRGLGRSPYELETQDADSIASLRAPSRRRGL